MLLQYTDILSVHDEESPVLFRFYADYSQRNDTLVFLYVRIKRGRTFRQVFVFDGGRMRCVAGSVEEGASTQTVYKKIGLCIGDDCFEPLSCILSLASDFIVFFIGKKMDEQVFRRLVGYKNLLSIPIVFVCSDDCCLADGRVYPMEEQKTLEIIAKERSEKNKKGYMTVHVLE